MKGPEAPASARFPAGNVRWKEAPQPQRAQEILQVASNFFTVPFLPKNKILKNQAAHELASILPSLVQENRRNF
jgi:hypothetical protein